MDADNKRILKNSIYLYARMLFVMATSLIASRLVLQALGVVDYGVYQVVGGIVALFTILNGTLAVGSSRFITFALGKGDAEKLKKVFNASFAIHCCMAVVIFILLETVGLWYINTHLVVPEARMSAANWVFQFSVFTCVVWLTQVPYSALIVAHERMNIYAYVSIAESVFRLALVSVLYFFEHDDNLIFYALSLALWSIALQIFYRVYCYRRFPESHLQLCRDKAQYKEMISFSIWDVFGQFTGNGNNQGKALLINYFFGIVYNASYGLALRIQGILQQFVSNFMTAVSPQITKSYAGNKMGRVHSLIFNSSKMGCILYSFIAIPIFFEADYLLELWLKDVPAKTAIFVRLAIILQMIRSCSRPVVVGIHASGNIKNLNLICGLGCVVCTLPGIYICYKLGGPIECAYYVSICWACIVNYLELFCLWMEDRSFSIWEYTRNVYFRCIIMCLSVSVILFLFRNIMAPSFLRLVLSCLISTVSIATLAYSVVISPSQREEVRNKIQSIIKQKLHR